MFSDRAFRPQRKQSYSNVLVRSGSRSDLELWVGSWEALDDVLSRSSRIDHREYYGFL